MYKKLEKYIKEMISDFDSIPSVRKNKLLEVADYIQMKLENDDVAKLNFICTHNSRRSHLAQIWTSIAAHYYGIENIKTYSGGTEATAFNPRAVKAIQGAGFKVEDPGGENPKYQIFYSEDAKPMICFSKKFDDSSNPDKNFAAVMTCSDADANCPFVPGAEFRKPITYRDPKESETYDERCRQIATEMFYKLSQLK